MSRQLIVPDALPKYGIAIGDKQRKRLEAEGKFPKRVPVTERTHAYVEAELLAHGEALIAARDGAQPPRRWRTAA